MINIEPFELRQLLKEVTEIAVLSYRIAEGKEKAWISQRAAWRIYGKSNVDCWLRKGIVSRQKDGERNSTVRYDRLELERAALTSNRYEREYQKQGI
jgi:hypothetical protein